MSDRLPRLLPVLIALAVAAVFANALGGAFMFDDVRDVAENPSAKAATFFAQLAAMNRPLTKASYAVQDALHGTWAAGFHAANVVLHVLAAALVFALVRRAARFAGMRAGDTAWLAAAVTAVWAVHPALSETVTYVSGRSMGFSALPMLGALLAATGAQGWAARGAAFACALLAGLARETALILPAVLLAWQWTLQPAESRRAFVLRLLPVAVGTGLAAAIVFLMPRHQMLVETSLAGRPPLEALRGNLFAATEIYRFWFEPWRVTILPAPPVIDGWSSVAALWRMALFAGLGVAAVMLRRRAPLVAFGIALALLALAPSNTILWRADPVGLKPLYLGGLGIVLALGAALTAIKPARAALLAAAAITAAWLGVLSVQRNTLFADPVALWRDAATKTPDETRPLIYLGSALMQVGRLDEAAAAFDAALAIDPFDGAARNAARLLAAIRGVDGPEPPP